jgi:hypothetical protein
VFSALQRIAAAVKRSAKALQRKHARSAEARSAADFKICSAALQRCTSKKVPIPEPQFKNMLSN